MSPIAEKWKDIGVDIPSLLPLQAAPQEESQIVPYLQSLHNYLAGDRQVVVRTINVLSRFRLFQADDAADTIARYNDFLFKATGFTSKQRRQRLNKKAKKGEL